MRLDPGRIEVLDDAMADILRRKTPAERLAIGFGMWESARKALTCHLADSHPDWDAARVAREVARRMAGEETWNSLPERLRGGGQ